MKKNKQETQNVEVRTAFTEEVTFKVSQDLNALIPIISQSVSSAKSIKCSKCEWVHQHLECPAASPLWRRRRRDI